MPEGESYAYAEIRAGVARKEAHHGRGGPDRDRVRPRHPGRGPVPGVCGLCLKRHPGRRDECHQELGDLNFHAPALARPGTTHLPEPTALADHTRSPRRETPGF